MKSVLFNGLMGLLVLMATIAFMALPSEAVDMPTAMCPNYQVDSANGGNYCATVILAPDLEYLAYWDNGDGVPSKMKHVMKNAAAGHEGYFAVYTRLDARGQVVFKAWSALDDPDKWELRAWGADGTAHYLEYMCKYTDPGCTQGVPNNACNLRDADANMRTSYNAYMAAVQSAQPLAISFYYELYVRDDVVLRACKRIALQNAQTDERQNVTP